MVDQNKRYKKSKYKNYKTIWLNIFINKNVSSNVAEKFFECIT